jgi:predicted GNAT superfamily acetyltransferase
MRRMRLTRRLCCLARACAVSRAYTRRVIRDAQPSDFGAILQLNAGSEHFLSPLDEAKLARLHGAAALHWVVEDAGVAQAFLLALREGVDYDSVNYRWFAARYPSFLYIDRVVVAPGLRGKGWGRQLYTDLFVHARLAGIRNVVCEFDLEPPNPASQRFHQAFGFTEVGRQRAGPAHKLVSLQRAPAQP